MKHIPSTFRRKIKKLWPRVKQNGDLWEEMSMEREGRMIWCGEVRCRNMWRGVDL